MGGAILSRLTLERLELAEANAFVRLHHRHHKPAVGHLFSLGAALDGHIVGVAIIGRPVARSRDDGVTTEVTRLATDGTANACSFLYGASARASFALGFKRIGTYILASEPGTSTGLDLRRLAALLREHPEFPETPNWFRKTFAARPCKVVEKESEPDPVCELIQCELGKRGWTVSDLAIRMDGDATRNRTILALYFSDPMPLGHALAHRIAQVLGWPDEALEREGA